MLRRIACSLMLTARKADRLRLLASEASTVQLVPLVAVSNNTWVQQCRYSSSSSSSANWLLYPKQQPQQSIVSPWQRPSATSSAVQQATVVSGQQLQQQRTLLGVVRHKNYQDHNKKKPKKYKIKTPSIVKRRVIVAEDGTMWRMQAGRRHKRYKKGRLRLLDLKGMVPLHSAHAAKLKKLGFKREWWHTLKA